MKSLSKKEKENIMKNAEKILERVDREDSKITYCEKCGEPSRNQICKMCELVGK